ncbi:FeoA family protein [Halobacteriovorax sp. GB3]|uniref:FeoA family protein n=1 Tax=Halobacteriovorax sp. GB3 TaxID=2719615 RepID=UPI00235DEC1D|nr:FeoA family protein [Halobacteriovorax sp. GB3]MDD0854892.1 FeoA family protein [Halobacteriovorax sp. GB3]
MVLSKIKKGQIVKIKSFNDAFDAKALMVGVGLLPGDEVTIISQSFLGSPLTIRLKHGELIAMRTKQAELINVEVIAG